MAPRSEKRAADVIGPTIIGKQHRHPEDRTIPDVLSGSSEVRFAPTSGRLALLGPGPRRMVDLRWIKAEFQKGKLAFLSAWR